jgi:excisionase family DNA binding protein
MPDLTLYMTTEDAAKKLGYHPESIRRMLRDKELEGLKWGSYWLVSKKSIDKYQRKNDGLNKFDPRRG